MSRTWERYIKIIPAFEGTEEQKKQNVESHAWARVDLAKKYGQRGMQTVVQCLDCEVLASGNAAEYPCIDVQNGKLPKPVPFDVYANRTRNTRTF